MIFLVKTVKIRIAVMILGFLTLIWFKYRDIVWKKDDGLSEAVIADYIFMGGYFMANQIDPEIRLYISEQLSNFRKEINKDIEKLRRNLITIFVLVLVIMGLLFAFVGVGIYNPLTDQISEIVKIKLGENVIKTLEQETKNARDQSIKDAEKISDIVNKVNVMTDRSGIIQIIQNAQTTANEAKIIADQAKSDVDKKIVECRICFREIEGSAQCQGTRYTCSEWSSTPDWTRAFRDDTDHRIGGCSYQWKIECR